MGVRVRVLLMGCAAMLLVSAATMNAAGPPAAPVRQAADAALVARGEYLANSVAMCVQCHSGRDLAGNIIESEKFKGGAIPFTSPWPKEEWAYRAPAIAGLPGMTDAQVIALLTEGKGTDRPAPRRPMPPFRLSLADAQAIVAYLRTR
jgi:Cytochrome C oxidase, cbb3-type, subunit III